MHPAEACYDAPRASLDRQKNRALGVVRAAIRRRVCEVTALLRNED